MRRMIRRRACPIALLSALAALAVLLLVSCAGGDGAGGGAGPAAQPASGLRTVAVERGAVPPSRPDGRLRARYLSGTLPGSAVEATVVTDEDCAPDEAGISRCLNRIRLPSGRMLAVRHPHDMSTVPCLAPGERVRVLDASTA